MRPDSETDSHRSLFARSRKASTAVPVVDDLGRFRGFLILLAQAELSPRLQSRESASDIVQQSLLEAHRDFAAFQGGTDAELAGWLKTILARNLLQAARRHHARSRDVGREQALVERLDKSSARLVDFLAAEESGASDRAMRNERYEQLAEGLSRLLDAERDAILLKHFHGYSLTEIGERLGRPRTAIAGLLKRGLKKLRVFLAESGPL